MSITLEVDESNRKCKEFHLKNFKTEELIGSGSYGSVYKVKEILTGNCFAIKRIEKTFENFILAKRTLRELKILTNLKHENIIGMHRLIKLDEFENKSDVDKDVFILMDLMDTDLHRVIYSEQELTERHIKYFMYQLVKGLSYIHSAKIVHRDLKPSNILVNSNCNLKIGDFGMARSISFIKDHLDTSSQDYLLTQYVATRWYRAPELMYFRNYSEKIDIWSAGCIFSELITRKPLFPSKNCMSSLKLIFSMVEFPGEEFCQSIQIPIIQKLLMDTSKNKTQDKLETLHKGISKSGIDLLKNILAIDFVKRYDTEKIMEHEFLNEFKEKQDEKVTSDNCLDFSFEIDLCLSKMKDEDCLNIIKNQILNEFYCDNKNEEKSLENGENKFILEKEQDISEGYFRPEPDCIELEDGLNNNSSIKDLLKKKLESKGIKKQDDIPIQKKHKTKESFKKNLKNNIVKDCIIESQPNPNIKSKNKIRTILPKPNPVPINPIILVAQPIIFINQPPVFAENSKANIIEYNTINEKNILQNDPSYQILTDNLQEKFKNLSVEEVPKDNKTQMLDINLNQLALENSLTIKTPKGTADGYSIGMDQDVLMSEVLEGFDFFGVNGNNNNDLDIFPSLDNIDFLNEIIDKDSL